MFFKMTVWINIIKLQGSFTNIPVDHSYAKKDLYLSHTALQVDESPTLVVCTDQSGCHSTQVIFRN